MLQNSFLFFVYNNLQTSNTSVTRIKGPHIQCLSKRDQHLQLDWKTIASEHKRHRVAGITLQKDAGKRLGDESHGQLIHAANHRDLLLLHEGDPVEEHVGTC